MSKRWAAFYGSLVATATLALPTFCADKTGGYAGLEFLGSSLISRVELEKILHLREGATADNGEKSLDKLRLALEKKSVKANVEVVPEGASYFISVDVLDSGLNNTTANRHLQEPRHVALPNERPFSLLQELKTRMEKLSDEGRPTSESYQDGVKYYSDVACQRTAERIEQELQGQLPYLIRILAQDPNGERRAQAAELLNWTRDPVRNCAALIPALDDSDMKVRMAACKYIWARIGLLPDNFPFDSLLEGLSRQLGRPSHHDRVRAMAALLALARRDSDSIGGIKTFDEAKLSEIASNSVIPSVQSLAKQVLSACANPPPTRKQMQQQDASQY